MGTCSAAAGTVTASLGSLPASGVATVGVQVRLPSAQSVTTIINTATVVTTSVDINPDNNTGTHTLIVDPVLKKRSGQITSQ
jgi:hypothetical protein